MNDLKKLLDNTLAALEYSNRQNAELGKMLIERMETIEELEAALEELRIKEGCK